MVQFIQGRKACRGGDSCRVRTFEELVYCVLHHSARSIDDIAARAGIKLSRLLDIANPARLTRLSAFEVGAICRAAEDWRIVEWIARDSAGVFFGLPRIDGAAAHGYLKGATDILSEVGDVIKQIDAAVQGDNTVDAKESVSIDKEVDEAIAALMRLKHLNAARRADAAAGPRALREAPG